MSATGDSAVTALPDGILCPHNNFSTILHWLKAPGAGTHITRLNLSECFLGVVSKDLNCWVRSFCTVVALIFYYRNKCCCWSSFNFFPPSALKSHFQSHCKRFLSESHYLLKLGSGWICMRQTVCVSVCVCVIWTLVQRPRPLEAQPGRPLVEIGVALYYQPKYCTGLNNNNG